MAAAASYLTTDWNTPYWRDLGAPWGGAHSTTGDVTRFLLAFLHPGGRVLQPATAHAMIVNQTGLDSRWRFGWMIKPAGFGNACSPHLRRLRLHRHGRLGRPRFRPHLRPPHHQARRPTVRPPSRPGLRHRLRRRVLSAPSPVCA